MGTRIDIEYDRQFTDSDVQEIVGRAATTSSVLQQLGADYQSLPGIGKADYDMDLAVLQSDINQLNGLIDQIRPLLVSIDAKTGPLDEKNKAALRTLSGLLQSDADKTLLAQITG